MIAMTHDPGNTPIRRASQALLALALAGLTIWPRVSGATHWQAVGENETSIRYIDTDSIHRVGDITRYRMLMNFRQRVMPALSTVYDYEIRCSTGEMRATRMTSTTQHFGEGALVSVIDPATLLPGRTNLFSRDYDKALQLPNRVACGRRQSLE